MAPNGLWFANWYDKNNRVITQREHTGNIITLAYTSDPKGSTTAIDIDSSDGVTEHPTFDSHGYNRTEIITYPNGLVEHCLKKQGRKMKYWVSYDSWLRARHFLMMILYAIVKWQ